MSALATIRKPGAVLGSGCAGEDQADTAWSSSPTFLTLPAPPSVNALYKNVPGKGRVRTALYDDWLANAGWKLRSQKPAPVPGPCVIVIGIERTNNCADIDNRLKPTLDLLVKHRVIKDDKHVVGIAAAWNPSRDGLMRLAIVPAGPMALRFQLADKRHGGWFIDGASSEEEAI